MRSLSVRDGHVLPFSPKVGVRRDDRPGGGGYYPRCTYRNGRHSDRAREFADVSRTPAGPAGRRNPNTVTPARSRTRVTHDDRTQAPDAPTSGPGSQDDTPAYIPVLLYHAVNDFSRPDLADFTTAPAMFARHVERLAGYVARGWTPMLAADLSAALRGATTMPAHPFAVTFDDGYDDNVAAIAALAEAGISSTIYVTGSYVGQPGFLDAAQLRSLAARPLVEVGAHSVRHRRLDELSRPEIIGELRGSRSFLAQVTSTEIASVAYPHGNHDARVLDEVRSAGYSSGAAVKNALSRPGDDPLAFARWTVLAHHTADDVAAVIDGKAPVVGDSERLQTRIYRHVRRVRTRARRLVGRAG